MVSLYFLCLRGVVLVAVPALSACVTSVGGQPSAVATVGAQAAVFQRMFEDNSSSLKGRAVAFCIGTGQGLKLQDSHPAVLRVLRANPKVKPASACDADARGQKVIDRASGLPSLLFGVGQLDCASARECQFWGGYYESNLSAQVNVYRVRLIDGAWRVTLTSAGPVS